MATTPLGWGTTTGSLRRRTAVPWRHLDLGLAAAALAVAGLGVLMVFSATRGGLDSGGSDPATYLKRQLLFLGVGCGVAAVTTMVDYRLARDVSPLLYGGVLVLLLAVLSPLGTVVNGSQSWFAIGPFQLQPAEFGKVAVIILLAAFCAAHAGGLDLRRLLVALGLVGLPAVLILLQPDLGSALVYAAIAMGMLLVAGARPRHIVAVTLLAAITVGGAFSLGVVELEDYQRDRFSAFLDSGADERGAGYNQEQSKRAIGNGGLTGAGLLQGSQTRLGFVPEQQTDFIFTVVGEELGFLGSATLLLLYVIMAWRIWHAARVARDMFGTLICAGVLSMLVFQVFQSVGMTTGIMPVTGIPLPLLSYGGSSMLTMAVAVGLVLNVHMHRYS
jgi:rod shape determining protein RodA